MSFRGMGNDNKDFRLQPTPSAAITPLVRQPSTVYSLTLEEFQNSMGGIGKDYGSMNMDEFLKNIWTAEESQAMAAALGATDDGVGGAQGGLQRQGSLTLPRTLSQKTVDEVWRNLINESGAGDCGSGFQHQHQQRQPTLGEITLEEFLVRAGVVREENDPSISRPVVNSAGVHPVNSLNVNSNVYYGDLSAPVSNNSALGLAFPQADRSYFGVMPSSNSGNSSSTLTISPAGTRPFATPLPLGNNINLGSPQGMKGGGLLSIRDAANSNGLISGVVGFGGGGVNVGASVSPANHVPLDGLMKGNGELSSLSPVSYVFNGGLRGRKRSGAVEKVVERRQKRMIKNRESAARSRARKQAYTMELEDEVAKLKEQNQELQKKQAEILELQRNQFLELLNHQRGTKNLCLRRTQTGPW